MRGAGPVPVAPRRSTSCSDAAGFIYTGGTTGVSKGAMLSHRNLVANAMQGASYLNIEEGTECLLGSLPFFHSFGMLVMNVAILRAGKLVADPEPARSPPGDGGDRQGEADASCRASRASSTRSNESPLVEKFDLRSVKACISGAAPLPTAVAERSPRSRAGPCSSRGTA